jgi:tyrosine-specific transport protein
MTISALLTSELLINRSGETGRVRNVGLLELYTSYLGEFGGKAAGIGFLLVSYIVMGVYLSEGGDMLMRMLEMTAASSSASASDTVATTSSAPMISDYISNNNNLLNNEMISRTIFATVVGSFLAISAKLNNVQRAMTHFFVPITLLAFLSAIAIGLPTIDFKCLFAPQNQHPEVVLNAFPLLFMSWTYHGVVPRVVYDLEGDKNKITKAIILGSTTALVMYGLWTAMVLGNAMGDGSIDEHVVETLSNAASSVVGSLQTSSGVVLGDFIGMEDGSSTSALSAATSLSHYQFSQPLLQPAVEIVTEMAVVTSLIGVVLGFVNEFNDAVGTLPSKSYGPKEDNKWKLALLTLLPPAMLSIGLGYYSGSFDVNNYEILDYTGIFGSSILFLILPAQLAWKNRYGDDDRPLTVRPMVPLGKIPLGSLYKAAGTLIIEQGLEKLGVFDFFHEQWSNFSG